MHCILHNAEQGVPEIMIKDCNCTVLTLLNILTRRRRPGDFDRWPGAPLHSCNLKYTVQYGQHRSSPRISSKGQCHEIFCFRFFSWITFPQAPYNNISIISNFFENSREIFASQGAPPVSATPAANFATISPCVVFAAGGKLPPNLELRISPRIFKKIRNGLIGILWGWGETD